MSSHRRTIGAIFAVFFIESAVLGSWIPRIPDVKAGLDLSDSMLGLCLLTIPAGTLSGLLAAGRILEHTGLRRGCQIFLPLWALLFILPAFAGSIPILASALFLCGVAVGLVEVAMNTEADRIEQAISARIMSRCHGAWSLGSMAGALIGSAFAQFGVSVVTHYVIVMPLLAVAGLLAATMLPRLKRGEFPPPAGGDAPLFRLPAKGVLLLCVTPLGIMAVEGAFIDWSAVFMRSVLEASPLVIGLAYGFFSAVMAAVRLSGDWLAERFGDVTIVRVSGIAASLGVAIFALAPSASIAFVGATLAGMGVAVVYPLSVSAAARRPGRSSADNVASITMISFCAFLILPPVIGFLSDLIGLRWALLTLVPMALTTALLAGEVGSRTRRAAAAPDSV